MLPVLLDNDPVGPSTVRALEQIFVRVDGRAIAVNGASVVAHGDPPHASATMVATATGVKIDGVPVCRSTDAATCGHVATATSHVTAT